MPRSGPTGTYSLPPIYLAIPGTTIVVAQHNTPLEDIATTFNTVQPITYGGTGASSASGARSALGILQGFGALTNIAGGSTIDLANVTTNNANVTGAGWSVTSFGSPSNSNPIFQITFADAGTIVYNGSSMILPGGTNIATAAGDTARAMYLGGGNWRVLSYSPAAAYPVPFPVGSLIPYAGTAAPARFIFPYGQAISRTTYAALFVVCGTTYGAGDGSTTFNVPDVRGRTLAGKDNMGGSSASRLTTGGSGVDGSTLGAAGGAQNIVLTVGQLAKHGHPWLSTNSLTGAGANGALTYTNSASAVVYPAFTGSPTSTLGQHIGGSGNDEAHNNVQPTIVLNMLMYAGA